MTVPPDMTPVTVVVEMAQANSRWQPTFGSLGEWAAAAATLGALVFAWRQLRAERDATRVALEHSARAVQVAQAQLDLERERREAEVRAEVEQLARLTELDVAWGMERPIVWFRVEFRNRSALTVSSVYFHIELSGTLEEVKPGTPPSSAEPGKIIQATVRPSVPVSDPSVIRVRVSFEDALGRHWMRDAANGSLLEPFDPRTSPLAAEREWWSAI